MRNYYKYTAITFTRVRSRITCSLIPKEYHGEFNTPEDVALDSTGHVYVADRDNNRIQVFHWKTDVGGPGGGINQPGVAVK